MDDMIGRTLGQYQLLGILTTDALGAVYEALDSNSQAPREVRVLSSAVVDAPGGVERLADYIRIATALPPLLHVSRLLDAGEAEGRRYLVADSFGGQSLAQLMDRVGSFAPRHMATVLAQMAEGLDALHAQGVLHGDVRPENVVVNPEGRVMLRNVGLARALRNPEEPEPITAYTSPEVLAGGPGAYGPAAEVYALGQTVYATLAGQAAFDGDADTLRQQALAGQAAPLTGPAEAVDAAVRRALQPTPEARWPTAGAFAAAFQAALTPAAAPPPEQVALAAAVAAAAPEPPPAAAPEPPPAAAPPPELPPTPTPAPAPGGGPMWLWILLALALVLAVAWLVNRQDTGPDDGAAPTTTPVVVPSPTPGGAAIVAPEGTATRSAGPTATRPAAAATSSTAAAATSSTAAAATSSTAAAATRTLVAETPTTEATTETTATLAVGPQVTFIADRETVTADEPCVTLIWQVEGAEVVYLSSQGQPELEVDANGDLDDCLEEGQVKTFTLRAVAADGATTTQQVIVSWP